MAHCMVITTCAERDEAENTLVDRKLAACVQINTIVSYFTWKGKINKESEYRLLIKTKEKLYKRVENYIKKMHSYEVPEIIKIPIHDGSKEYLDWIDEVTEYN